MRKGYLSKFEAYQEFDRLWKGDDTLGIGAAYFTKLIFFCEPSHEGYIMDQWTSKSINLLTGEKVVHLLSGHVSKKNDVGSYQRFCSLVEEIAQELNIPAEKVEMAMFSKGGKNKAAWRKHVVHHVK